MSRPAVGEVIDLRWEDWCPDFLYVRGHVSPAVALDALAGHYGPDGDEYRYGDPVAAWGRLMRTPVLAKHVDLRTWRERREGTRYDCALRRAVPRTPPEDRCPCTDYMSDRCACGGACDCHWSENVRFATPPPMGREQPGSP